MRWSEIRQALDGTLRRLQEAGVDVTLLCDNAAASLMRSGEVQCVVTGADRIAANGDVANKIGTYALAVLANAHDIPFYVSAPLSTIDFDTPTGAEIVIEERNRTEVTHGFGRQTAPEAVTVYNPAFDVTPNHLVTAIVTEHGVVRAPYQANLAALRTPEPTAAREQ